MAKEDEAATEMRDAIDRGEAGEEEKQEKRRSKRRGAASNVRKWEKWQEKERRRLTEAGRARQRGAATSTEADRGPYKYPLVLARPIILGPAQHGPGEDQWIHAWTSPPRPRGKHEDEEEEEEKHEATFVGIEFTTPNCLARNV